MNTHFEVSVKTPDGFVTINFNNKCNYIKEFMNDFIAFMNSDKDGEILLRIIHKDQILQIENVGTEE